MNEWPWHSFCECQNSKGNSCCLPTLSILFPLNDVGEFYQCVLHRNHFVWPLISFCKAVKSFSAHVYDIYNTAISD